MPPFLARHFPRLRFSWWALLLAPMVTPLIAAALMGFGTSKADGRWGAFLVIFVLGCIVSFPCTIGLLLPGLCVLSRLTVPSAWKVVLLGLGLGLLPYLVIGWINWKSSGPDSGPPEETFLHYLATSWTDILPWLCLVSGAITAGVYHAIATRVNRSQAQEDSSREPGFDSV